LPGDRQFTDQVRLIVERGRRHRSATFDNWMMLHPGYVKGNAARSDHDRRHWSTTSTTYQIANDTRRRGGTDLDGGYGTERPQRSRHDRRSQEIPVLPSRAAAPREGRPRHPHSPATGSASSTRRPGDQHQMAAYAIGMGGSSPRKAEHINDGGAIALNASRLPPATWGVATTFLTIGADDWSSGLPGPRTSLSRRRPVARWRKGLRQSAIFVDEGPGAIDEWPSVSSRVQRLRANDPQIAQGERRVNRRGRWGAEAIHGAQRRSRVLLSLRGLRTDRKR